MSQGAASAPVLRRHWLGRPGWAALAIIAAVLVVVPVAMLITGVLRPDTEKWREQWDTRLPDQIVTTPLPTTGPYMASGYDPNSALTLVRNPNFTEWSRDAQPQVYPDVIDYRFGQTEGQRAFLGSAGPTPLAPTNKEARVHEADRSRVPTSHLPVAM